MDLKFYLKFWKDTISRKPKIIDYKYKSIFEIDLNIFTDNKIKLVIFDYDDTLTDFHGDISEKTINWLKDLQSREISVAVISNFPEFRLNKINENLKSIGISVEKSGNKPNPTAYSDICLKNSISTEESAMVGDRIGTDIYGAYLAGIKIKILVRPFSSIFGGKKTTISNSFIRKFEKLFY